MAGLSLPLQGADPRKYSIFFLLPPQFLVIKGICSSACAGIGALIPAAAFQLRGCPGRAADFYPHVIAPALTTQQQKTDKVLSPVTAQFSRSCTDMDHC